MNTTNKQKILGGKRIEGHINVANTGIRSICLFPNGCSNFMTPASPPVKNKKINNSQMLEVVHNHIHIHNDIIGAMSHPGHQPLEAYRSIYHQGYQM